METHKSRRFFPLSVVIFLLVSLCATLQAQQTVHGSVPRYVKQLGLHSIARLDNSRILTLGIGLSLQNRQALTNLLQQLYTPGNPNFHHWLTPSEFTAEFAPSEAAYQGVVNYLEAIGFAVTKTYPNRMLIDANGTVGDIERAFHLTMMVYDRPSGGGTFYAPDSEPTLNVTTPIAHISGLRDDIVAVSHAKFTPLPTTALASPLNNTGSVNGFYDSKDIRAAYAPGVSLTGSGQTVGLLELDGFYYIDISTYESRTGLTTNPPTVDTVLVDGFNGNPMGREDEVTLDIEMAMAMAPNLSKIVSFETTGTQYTWEQHYNDILADMAQDNYIKQFSSSWTLSGGQNGYEDITDATADNSFLQMATDGQSFFQASGDGDAVINSTWIGSGDTVYSYFGFPADDPNVTSVGGTELRTTGPGGSYVSEAVWNPDIYDDSNHAFEGSSGGVSNLYSIPSWQKGVNPSNNQVSSTWRNVPDVALTADSLYEYVDQTSGIGNGTSAAAPLWAGFVALANQQAAAGGNSSIGFLNPLIYAIGQSGLYSSDCHDIPAARTNNNAWAGSSGLYSASSGYDLTAGWGTPTGQHLIGDLISTNWSGDKVLSSTFTVNSGQTVSVLPGSNITFSNGSGIIVHGTLNVYGTSSQPVTMTSSSGNWAGITFANSSTGNVQDCTISYASSPVVIDTANVTISGCTINHSSFYGGNGNTAAAIQVWDSNPTITNTVINGESDSWNGIRFGNGSIGTVTGCTVQNLGAGNGIVIQGGSSPSIISTRITGNYYYGIIENTNTTGNPVINSDYVNANGIVGGSKYYQGIYLIGSTAHLNMDTVSNSNVGILCYDYSSPSSGQAGENIVIDNNTGIDANTYSSPVFGHAIGNPPVTYDGTCNQIYSNASNSLYAVNHSSIKAEYNWWGHYPPSGGFYADGTSSLDYSNGLTSPADCPSSGSPTIATNSATANSAATPTQVGLWDEDAGNWKLAAAEYVGILKDSSSVTEKSYALERLYHVFQASKDTSMFGTFETLADSTGPLTSIAQEILANAYAGAGRLSGAETMANNLISQYPGTGIAQRALILLASLYQIDPSYSQVSSTALAELEQGVANTTDAGLIPALTMGQVSALPSGPLSQNKQVALGKDSTSSAPLKFELGNYPNPFNPTTVIKYEIPKDTHVTLRVYDVLGRMVVTLVDGEETMGVHEVTFDGSRFASGVYFYRLTTPTHSNVMKMLLIK